MPPEKDELRHQLLARRDAEPDRESRSRLIQDRLLVLPEFDRAERVLTYIGVKSEVGTERIVQEALRRSKRVAVPYVAGDVLRAAYISSPAELAPAGFGLLEPLIAVREDPARHCALETVDLFVVPGVGFDRRGGRLGHGRAYYDRMLAGSGRGARFIAVAFACQVVPVIPMTPTDVYVHAIVTERETVRPAGPPPESS